MKNGSKRYHASHTLDRWVQLIMKHVVLALTLIIFQSSVVHSQYDSSTTYDYGIWGIGAELGPCTGMFFLTGNANEMLNDMWCYANVGVTFSHKRTHFIVQTGGISGSIKESLGLGPEWKKGNHFGSVNLQLSLGYELLNTKHFNIIPFLSGGITAFNTQVDSIDAIGTSTNWTPSYSFGSAFDFKINFFRKKKHQFPGHEFETRYLYFRLITGMYPTYFNRALDIHGAMYFVNLSVGVFYKPPRKLY